MFSRSLHGSTWQQRTEPWQRDCAGASIREIAADLARILGAVLGLIRPMGGMPSRHA